MSDNSHLERQEMPLEHLGWHAVAAPAVAPVEPQTQQNVEMYPSDLFTVRETTNRDIIQNWGIKQAVPGSNEGNTPSFNPAGVYVWTTFEDAVNYADRQGSGVADIWKIPGGTIPQSIITQINDNVLSIGSDIEHAELVMPAEDLVQWPDEGDLPVAGKEEQTVMQNGPSTYYNIGTPDPVNKQIQRPVVQSPGLLG